MEEIEKLQKENTTLENRLAKATEVFKAQKEEMSAMKKSLEAAEARIAELEAAASSPVTVTTDESQIKAEVESLEKLNHELKSEVESLQKRNAELDAELTINGNNSDEVAKLTERLEKAKEIFASFKTEVESLKADNAEKVLELERVTEEFNAERAEFTKQLNSIKELVTVQSQMKDKELAEAKAAMDELKTALASEHKTVETLTEKLKSCNSSISKIKQNTAARITEMKQNVGFMADAFDEDFREFNMFE